MSSKQVLGHKQARWAAMILGVFVAAAGVTQEADDAPANEPLGFPQHMLIAEASDWSYTIDFPDDADFEGAREALWPERDYPMSFRVETTETGRSLMDWGCAEEAWAAISRGEEFYEKREFEEAGEEYRRALEIDGQCYIAHTHLGDTILFGERDAAAALHHYTVAAELNPLDYRPHFFRGSALIRLGRRDEAIAAWRRTLARRPNYPVLQQMLEANEGLGIRMKGPFLHPQVALAMDATSKAVDVKTGPNWIAYGLCKALWWTGDRSEDAAPKMTKATGEESRQERKARRRREQETIDRLSQGLRDYGTTEERECLLAQLAFYDVMRSREDGDPIPPDPQLDLIWEIAAARQLDSLIIYDLLSHVAPETVLLLGDDVRNELEEFVARWVLVDEGLAEP